MFTWLKKLLAVREFDIQPAPKAPVREEVPPRDDLFEVEEKLIYTHLKGYTPTGQKVFVRKDPIELYRRVMEHGQEISINSKVARSASKGAPECWVKLVSRLREVFEIPPVEEGGLPSLHMVKLLNHFMDYCGSVKKNLPTVTTSASATSAGTPDSGTSTAASPPTTPTTSASGSTATETSTDTPTPSSSGCPSPSEKSQPG
jgi:hypothetical protein